mmetsp:Transcript_55634/g.102958  ORF Transcript_55634/g.102958 Transcript_55634/m.102958 type:complete len:120 (-) Transcript_55634:45-404(-)
MVICGSFIPGGELFVWAAASVYFASMRARLRGKLGGSPQLLGEDLFRWFCIPCCTSIQEAQEIDLETRTRVDCCCDLIKDYDGHTPLVGGAVEVTATNITSALRAGEQPVTPEGIEAQS